VKFDFAGQRVLVTGGAHGFGRAISAGTPMPNIPQMGAVWGPWSNAVAQSVQKPNANYSGILDSAVKEINSNIK